MLTKTFHTSTYTVIKGKNPVYKKQNNPFLSHFIFDLSKFSCWRKWFLPSIWYQSYYNLRLWNFQHISFSTVSAWGTCHYFTCFRILPVFLPHTQFSKQFYFKNRNTNSCYMVCIHLRWWNWQYQQHSLDSVSDHTYSKLELIPKGGT